MRKVKRRNVQSEHIDYDYLEKLSPDELKWLQEFTNSYYSGGSGPLARGDGAERDNAARRDIYVNAKRAGLTDGLKEAQNDGTTNVSERLADWSDDNVAAGIKKRREGYKAYRAKLKRDAGQGTDE